MTRLEDSIEGVKNLNVDVAEENGDVVFLHKIVEGSASRSYGIHVAKLAGAPKELLERAEERPVSYTHLDVYKRQWIRCPGREVICRRIWAL